MKKPSLPAMGLWLGSIVLMVTWTDPAHAQFFGSSSSGISTVTMTSYNFSGVGSYFSGSSTAYIPFSGMGGFIPYSPGPRGGLGVQPGMRTTGGQMQASGMGSMLGSRPSLGLIRGQIAPLVPIGLGAMGSRVGGGMGAMGGLIRRTPSSGPMGGMARPPVGSYPFRQPPSLLGPATASPSMSM
ncbi:MAG: hypothetical protein ACLP7Q_07500 [Isosphaeraceae bacterium]